MKGLSSERYDQSIANVTAEITAHRLAATLVHIPMQRQLAILKNADASCVPDRLPGVLTEAFKTADGIITCLSGDPSTTAVRLALLGLPRSSIYHLLGVLTSRGFARHLPEERRYGLGVAVYELGSAYQRQAPLQRVARLVMDRLVDDTPRRGAGGRRIAFVHPKATAGILLELTE